MRFRDGSDKGRASNSANLGESVTEILAMIKQAFGEDSRGRTWEVQTHRDRKRARQVKSKVINMLIIFFGIKGIVHKEFVLQDRLSIPHTAVTVYGYCVKMCEDFTPNIDDKITDCCITTTHV
jgi:hypothetical protein